jgi:microcystin-dependent protein
MTEPFLGQISMVGFNFAPAGWAQCNGQILPIQQNTALFSLLGTQFGGNGTQTFALPNLQSCVPMGRGSGSGLEQRDIGDQVGSESVTLLTSEMPAHTHAMVAQNLRADRANANGSELAASADMIYANTPPTAPLVPTTLTQNGGNQPHNNMQPFLTINFVIALSGVFPARN